MNLRELDGFIEKINNDYQMNLGRKLSLEEAIEEGEKRKMTLAANDTMFREELAVIMSANAKQIKSAAEMLSSAASYSLNTVFGSEYESLDIELDFSSANTRANIVLKKHFEGEVYDGDPHEDNGGGVNDVVSSLLKLSALTGYEPAVDNALLADEPSKHLSAKYREGLAQIYREMAEKAGRQIIMCTHDPAITVAADKIISFDERGEVDEDA